MVSYFYIASLGVKVDLWMILDTVAMSLLLLPDGKNLLCQQGHAECVSDTSEVQDELLNQHGHLVSCSC